MTTVHVDATPQEPDKQPKPVVPLWRNRDYWILISGQAISSAGTQVSQLAFPLLILLLTHSPAQAGIAAALRGLPYALMALPAGALVDRWNRKRVMLLCDTGRAIALGSVAVAMLLGHVVIVHLYVVSLVEGILFVFFQMAESSAIPHIVAQEQLTDATGQNEVLYSTAIMIGPSIGGFLYSLSHVLPFLSDAISYALSVLSFFFIKAEFQDQRVSKRQHLWLDVKEGLLWLWHHPLMRFLAILTCGITTPCYGYALIIIVLAQGQHASTLTIGLILGSGGIGSIVGSLLASPLEKRFGFARVIIVSVWVWSLTWLFYALAPNPVLLGVFNCMSFAVVPIYMIVQYSYRLAAIPDALRGRVNSVFRLIAFGGQPLGLALTGFLLQAVGPVLTVVILFVPQGVLAIVTTFNKHVRAVHSVREPL